MSDRVAASGAPLAGLLPALERALAGLRFGAVELVVHDGRVVQIERREKLRLEPDPSTGGRATVPHEAPSARPDDRSRRHPICGEER